MTVMAPERLWLLVVAVAVVVPAALPVKYVPKWKKQVSLGAPPPPPRGRRHRVAPSRRSWSKGTATARPSRQLPETSPSVNGPQNYLSDMQPKGARRRQVLGPGS